MTGRRTGDGESQAFAAPVPFPAQQYESDFVDMAAVRFASRDLISLALHAQVQGFKILSIEVRALSGRPIEGRSRELENAMLLAVRDDDEFGAFRAFQALLEDHYIWRIALSHPVLSKHQSILIGRHGTLLLPAKHTHPGEVSALVTDWMRGENR